MAGKKNSVIKSILLAVLFACAVIQTGMLWLDGNSGHNFFYYLTSRRFSQSDSSRPIEQIRPMDIAVGTGDNNFKRVFGSDSKLETLADDAVMRAVSQSKPEEPKDINWDDCLKSKCAVYEFKVSVPFGEYFMGMGLSDNRTPEYMKSFTHIVVVPYDSEIKNGAVYFINTESGSFESAVYYLEESNGLSAEIDSVMSDKDIDIRYISTAVSGFSIFSRNVFVPQFTVSGDSLDGIDEIKCIDLSQASEEYLISQTEQFFSKYTAKTVSFEPSGTYTVSDSTTVVKCYPSGVLEYFSYGGDSSRESQTLSSAYYACVEFLKKDISIKTGYYLSDVRLTGEGLIFCFDYHISGLPVMIGSTIKNDSGIDHAIEVAVVNNNVRKVKKLNANFIPKENAPEQIGVDFLTAVNYAMALNGGADKKIDDIELGYYASGTDSVGVCWFVHIDSTLYIIDAADGSLRIK